GCGRDLVQVRKSCCVSDATRQYTGGVEVRNSAQHCGCRCNASETSGLSAVESFSAEPVQVQDFLGR
ncbi:hypothetical protein PIB30_115992, partial [Stylosanthes scabra]|nr:hypothetical protein [Stylosanthes scabra]